MPEPTEILFDLLKQRKYEEVLPLLNENDNLINATNPNGSSLFQIIVKVKVTEQSRALLQFVATHPKLNFDYENPEFNLTNLDEMVSSANVEVFQSVIKNPQILFNRDKLTYECAKEDLVLIQRSLQKDLQKDPNSAATARSKTRAENQETIISLLRDATILHAMRTDDASLMQRLEQSGAKPSDRLGKLGNEKLPVHLLTASNPKIRAWFKIRFEQANAQMEANRYYFHNKRQEIDRHGAEQLAELKGQHLQAKAAVRQETIEGELRFNERVMSALTM